MGKCLRTKVTETLMDVHADLSLCCLLLRSTDNIDFVDK